MPQFTYVTSDKSHAGNKCLLFLLVSALGILCGYLKPQRKQNQVAEDSWYHEGTMPMLLKICMTYRPDSNLWIGPNSLRYSVATSPQRNSRCPRSSKWARSMEEMQGMVTCAHQMLYQTLAKSRDWQASGTLFFCNDCLEMKSFLEFTFINNHLQPFGSEIFITPKNQTLLVAKTHICQPNLF